MDPKVGRGFGLVVREGDLVEGLGLGGRVGGHGAEDVVGEDVFCGADLLDCGRGEGREARVQRLQRVCFCRRGPQEEAGTGSAEAGREEATRSLASLDVVEATMDGLAILFDFSHAAVSRVRRDLSGAQRER